MDYNHSIAHYSFNDDGSHVHFTHVKGMVYIYAYDDCARHTLDGYIECVANEAVRISKLLKLPVRYYYRECNGELAHVQHDCRRGPLYRLLTLGSPA